MMALLTALVAAAGLAGLKWQAQPTWLANPSATATVRWLGDRWVFEVAEPAKGMKWSAELPAGALRLEPGGFLVVEYRARGMRPDGDYAIWLAGLPEGSRAAVTLREIISDGRWHTVAVDVDRRGIAGAPGSVAVHVQSTASGPATFELRRLTFVFAAPAGAQVIPPAPTPPPVPWRDDCSSAAAWKPQPSWLGNPDAAANITSDGQSLRLSVSHARRGMKFSRRLAKPLDLASHRFLAVRYRARGLADHYDYFIYFGSAVGGLPPKQARPIRIRDLRDDGAWHVAVVYIREGFKAREMALQIQADEPNAFVEVDYIALYPRRPRLALGDVFTWRDGWPQQRGGLAPMRLPSGHAPASEVLPFVKGWFASRRITAAGVPFYVPAADGLLATPGGGAGEVSVPLTGAATEIYLLLAIRLPQAMPRHYSEKLLPVHAVRLPERVVVRLTYTDGETDEAFPAALPAGEYAVFDGLGVYVVPVLRREPLAGCSVAEDMSGRLAVVGLTVNRGPARYPAELGLTVGPGEVGRADDEPPQPEGPPAVKFDSLGRLVAIGGRVPVGLKPALPFAVFADGRALEPSRPPRVRRRDGVVSLDYALGQDTAVSLVCSPVGREVQMKLAVTNTGQRPRKLRVVFPRFEGLRLGASAGDDWIMLPRRAAFSTARSGPLDARITGGDVQLQFITLYDRSGCFYIRGLDRRGTWRKISARKTPDGTMVGFACWEQTLAPGQRLVPPAWAISVGPGDWHLAFEAHRAWLQRVFARPLAPRKPWFRRIFCFHQRFAHSEPWREKGSAGRWRVDELVDEDEKAFGVAEYFHFFDWGASRKYGRVGDYSHYEELGGLEAFRDAVRRLQRRGVRVGLYFEGYLVDSRSLAGRAHLDEWAMRDASGKPQMWPGSKTETVVCPFCRSWQHYLAGTVARVEQQVGADGYYLDELGMVSRVCFSSGHGHPVPWPVPAGELELIEAVRQALPSSRALYTEEAPVDCGLHLLDGSFTYAIWQWAARRRLRAPLGVVRFAAPEFKTFEIVSFRPFTDPEVWTLARYAFFNGEGIWLQGRRDHFCPQALELLRHVFAIISAHADAFCSRDVQPMVPTLVPGVYANRFASRYERLFTIYNGLHHTVRGEVLCVRHIPGARYFDLWSGRPIRPRIAKGWAYLAATLGPGRVGCLAQVFERRR